MLGAGNKELVALEFFEVFKRRSTIARDCGSREVYNPSPAGGRSGLGVVDLDHALASVVLVDLTGVAYTAMQ